MQKVRDLRLSKLSVYYLLALIVSAIVFMKEALRASMTKSCSQTDTVLALRRAVVDKYKVAQMTLNDPNCIAQTNETHWILKTTR